MNNPKKLKITLFFSLILIPRHYLTLIWSMLLMTLPMQEHDREPLEIMNW
jgi:hypothetical protein